MTKEGIRIVIINDDPNDVRLLRRCLINEGGQKYRFGVAKNGEKGIHACQTPGSRRPDCVIVDLHLPDMSGLDVLKRLKDDAGEVQYPVVLFIDSGEECKAATAALRAGAHDYIARSWLTADGLACAVENAIERFRLQERLRKKRAAMERQDREFKAIVESSEDAIISKTLDGVIRSWNAGAERLFGYSRQEAVGRSITLIIPPERQDEDRAILDQLCRGERVEHFETVRVSKDGRRLDISLTISPVCDDTGHVIGASKIARDISEQKRAENALRESWNNPKWWIRSNPVLT